jgi:uncharacterized protein
MKKILIFLIEFYQTFSKYMPPRCRFYPSCSEYTREAIEIHGSAAGVWLGIKRFARCHPFNPGGHDPVHKHLGE